MVAQANSRQVREVGEAANALMAGRGVGPLVAPLGLGGIGSLVAGLICACERYFAIVSVGWLKRKMLAHASPALVKTLPMS